jgi:hypothetical protein
MLGMSVSYCNPEVVVMGAVRARTHACVKAKKNDKDRAMVLSSVP